MNKKQPAEILPFFGGLILAVLGVSLLLWPEAIIHAFPVIIGIVLLLIGCQSIAYSLIVGQKLPNPGFKLMQGIITLIIGLVFLIKQDVSLVFLSVLFGLYILFSAILDLSAIFQNRKNTKNLIADLIVVFLYIILGLLLLFAPFSGLAIWVRFLGVYFLFASGGMFRWWAGQKNHPPNN